MLPEAARTPQPRDGMQAAPGLALDVARLRIVGRPLVGRLRPGGRVVTDELGSMPPRPAGGRLGVRIDIEAAARARAHQEADRFVGQGQAQLHRVVPRVEADDGSKSRRGSRWRSLAQPGVDQCGSPAAGCPRGGCPRVSRPCAAQGCAAMLGHARSAADGRPVRATAGYAGRVRVCLRAGFPIAFRYAPTSARSLDER
jgi:hypothetical protein